MAEVTPFRRRSQPSKAPAMDAAQEAEPRDAYSAFDDPEKFRDVIHRQVNCLRSTVNEGNRFYTEDCETSTLLIKNSDQAVICRALMHLQALVEKAQIVPCRPVVRGPLTVVVNRSLEASP